MGRVSILSSDMRDLPVSRTDTENPRYFARNVDCQHACPAGTNVPEYIRLIAAGRFTEAYQVNRHSNVFPGILGRVCDRPCEPACRRGRLPGEDPVAICRLKRVAADFKDDALVREGIVNTKNKRPNNGKHIALVGAGPASLTVANDLLPLGYQVTAFEKDPKLGGAMRRAVPAFRLPEEVLEEEINYVADLGLEVKTNHPITALSQLSANYDAVFVGTGAPLGRDLELPGRDTAGESVQIGLHWLAAVSFAHIKTVPDEVLVIGGGNTAMDCCRTALRLGAKSVHVAAPEAFANMLALPWEKDDALAEGVTFHNAILPQAYQCDHTGLTGVVFAPLASLYDKSGAWAPQIDTAKAPTTIGCQLVILAIGQTAAYEFIDDDCGVKRQANGLPVLEPQTFRAPDTNIFFGGDAALGPRNIITAVAQGHEAALSIELFLTSKDPKNRPQWQNTLASQKMGLHEWSYGNSYSEETRQSVPHLAMKDRFQDLKKEVELGYDLEKACQEAERCLNCDVQTVFSEPLCIECDACIDICPTDCLSLTTDGPDAEVKTRLVAPFLEPDQNFFKSSPLKTLRVMAKDENVCLHCGLCAERCPTGAWDMQKNLVKIPQAGDQRD